MPRKVILDVDPGIADALALCVALNDPGLDVLAVTATGGNVAPDLATRNVQAIVEQLDPHRWPRIGAADSQQSLRADRRDLYGANGLCGANFGVAELHHRHPSAKVLAEEIRAAPGEVTIVAGGPLSNLATVLQREPDLATLIGHLIFVGGTLHGPGDITAAAEFNVFCDAEAARVVFGSPVTKTMLPLDVTSTLILDYGLMDQIPDVSTATGRVLRAILPGAFRAFHQNRGIEGICAPELVAVAVALHPELIQTEPMAADIETSGELTYGATVLDRRQLSNAQPNIDVAVELDIEATIDCVLRSLRPEA